MFHKILGSRLQNRLMLVFIVLAASPVLILGALSLYLIDLSHRHDVSSLEVQLIDQKIKEIEKFFADTLGILELRVGFSQKSEIELSQQQFLLQGLLEENQAFAEVSFISLEGKETAKETRGQAEVDLLDVSKLDHFELAQGGESYVGGVVFTLSGPMVTLAAPVRNRNDDIIQILSAEVNLSRLVRSVEAATVGNDGYIVLLDRNGALMAKGGTAKAPLGMDLSGLERARRVMRGEAFQGLADTDRYESFFEALPVVGAAKRIKDISWVLMVEWPLQDADRIIQDVRGQVMNLTLLSVLAVILLVPLLAVRLVRPIKTLEAAAQDIAQGKFEKRVEIQTQDELEDLGSAFNQMAQGLKRLQELKNEFVFIAAHELRTPVTAIKGYISMLLEGSGGVLSPKMKQLVEPVGQASERLNQLVDDILEIARSEAGRIKIEVFAVDIRGSVEAVLKEIKPLAAEKNISLQYERPVEMLLVLADTTRLKEVLANFISNAIKYNREGGWIKISHEKEAAFLTTRVEDNGMGMSVEDQKHLFEKFFRAESGKVAAITGTGLGLFISKELIEKMGGKVWVRSEEGKGSTFNFSLPVSENSS